MKSSIESHKLFSVLLLSYLNCRNALPFFVSFLFFFFFLSSCYYCFDVLYLVCSTLCWLFKSRIAMKIKKSVLLFVSCGFIVSLLFSVVLDPVYRKTTLSLSLFASFFSLFCFDVLHVGIAAAIRVAQQFLLPLSSVFSLLPTENSDNDRSKLKAICNADCMDLVRARRFEANEVVKERERECSPFEHSGVESIGA